MHKYLLFLGTSLAVAQPALADDGEIVVTATGLAQPAESAPQSITVITRTFTTVTFGTATALTAAFATAIAFAFSGTAVSTFCTFGCCISCCFFSRLFRGFRGRIGLR